MKFGIELELTASVAHAMHPDYGLFYDYVRNLLSESGIKNWHLDDDASCGNEFVSPPLNGEAGWAQVEQVIHCVNTAKEMFHMKRIIGNDTGVHFHFDANDLVKLGNRNVTALRNILILSAILEPLWYSMNPSARFDTNFAAPLNFNIYQTIRARDMTDLRDIWFRPYMGVQGHQDSFRIKNNLYLPEFVNNETLKPDKYDWTRYHGMNFVSVFKHGTIEFRYTHGSFETINLALWFEMYKKVVEAARTLRTKDIIGIAPSNIDNLKMNSIYNLHSSLYSNLKIPIDFLFKIIKPDARLLRFILSKIIKYSPNAIPKNVVKRILDYHGDFSGLMKIIETITIQSTHFKKNAYVYTSLQPTGVSEMENAGPLFDIDHPDADEAVEPEQ